MIECFDLGWSKDCQKSAFSVLVEWVKSEMRLLRNSYTKAPKPPPSGSARRNPSRQTIWLLEKLQFLSKHVPTWTAKTNLSEVF